MSDQPSFQDASATIKLAIGMALAKCWPDVDLRAGPAAEHVYDNVLYALESPDITWALERLVAEVKARKSAPGAG